MMSDNIPSSPAVPAAEQRVSPAVHGLSSDQRGRQRVLRIRITDIVTGQLKVGLSLPISLVSVAMRMGARFVPAGHTNAEILNAYEQGEPTGALVLEDVENGELVEISIEG